MSAIGRGESYENKIYNIAMVLLCFVAIYINLCLEEYKAIGAFSIFFIGVLALSKGKNGKRD